MVVVKPLPNGLKIAYTWDLLPTYKSWDDPPSSGHVLGAEWPGPNCRVAPKKFKVFFLKIATGMSCWYLVN